MVAKTEDAENQLNITSFHTYVYLAKAGKPFGPREVMRGENLTGPRVAYRNLQKLMDLGLVLKDEYVNYVVKEKVGLKGHVWLRKTFLPRFIVFGLVLTATFALLLTLPAIKKQSSKLNLEGIGVIMLAFGGYFMFNTITYYLTGGYETHPSVWCEVIGPLHNPNLWCIALFFLGLPVLVRSRNKKPE
ncbi:MAG: hypothetical protein NWE84_07680 [Candidatus Bathyarchaeota archaeon]|nr:hypothetical protein [Candidatus Bathyarchaeota archaeon]